MGKSKPGKSLNFDMAKQAALEALKAFRKEERAKSKKRSFHNMRLLMENYLDLVEHYEKIKYKAKDLDDYLENMDIYGVDPESEQGEIQIEAIKRSKTRTLIMITQMQTAIEMLKKEVEAKDEIEKYLTLKFLYMDQRYRNMKFNQRVKLISKEVNCHEVTLRRWNNEILKKLAIKLFGVDGLNLNL